MEVTQEARFWEPAGELVRCRLCPWHCEIQPGRTGVCGVRRNEGGTLRSLNYGRVTSLALDPIEKKPLYHFHPGGVILSAGSFGCNLSCSFCQNAEISQGEPPSRRLPPAEAAALAEEYRASSGNLGLAYTYNEPFIWYEYVAETTALLHERGLQNVLVTNGMVETEPLEELLPLIDAMNVDIKFWSHEHYRELCGGPGWRARDTVEQAHGRCHLEITTLIIPGYNDSDEELDRIFRWAASVDPQLPMHLSRYRPAYRLSVPATPPETLLRAYHRAQEYLQYVYVGNLHLPGTTDTECAQCGATLVERAGLSAGPVGLTREGRCQACGAQAPFSL
jgi:pyruvate formate lyase activating enzyme